MKKNYTNPEIKISELNALDIITASPLGALGYIAPSEGGSDPTVEDGIYL